MFNYNYLGSLLERLIKSVSHPMQVEFHPGPDCGQIHCRYCYGKLQKANDGILNIEDYKIILDNLIGKTHLIALAGITTDPMSYPFFKDLMKLINERKFNFGISSKGYALNDELCSTINSGNTDGSFMTLSLDAVDNKTYNLLHGCPKDSTIFEMVYENVKNFKSYKEKLGSKLRFKVAYLLFKENSSENHIYQFIERFSPFVDEIRFSIPQVPNIAKPIGFLSNEEIKQTMQIIKKYEKSKVVMLKFDKSEHDKSFTYCWAQRFNLTIDKSGNVFPCPQVASKNYNNICYGNVKENSIWGIWHSEKRMNILNMKVDDMKCRVCDRKDETLNVELKNILDIKNFM
jgi:radical SAM protein with 4Fe4S-binding SPASM domain